ncbi:nicotinate-nucleotide adenylyltransferase [Rhodoferax saidenbachensis]|uniref:Probable nicotinate-nucleotide adenylyltransferase n=1 Tax=Rhodoferax saidenbachensis TaxID=1484693 RepID=A0ABU1ZIC1_9BURK|nr:nicotinate (nicotinamide) nucleotide adenylyltransferase [Rhodoferax saidenbachensis]MDR7305282.1 nicotinate-nucleotide adenylyltransferase [Rhodoferax saidenbachensis]
MTVPAAASFRRIGVFGGAFDPPHLGHHALAVTAIAQLQLDALHIIPTGHAWHKSRTLSDASHRMAMAELAFADLPQVVVDGRELARPGPTYTVDTLLELQQENPGAQLYLLIGEDQAHALPGWSRWERLPALAIICVAARADSTGAKGQFDALKAQVPGLTVLNMPPVDTSATDIRHRATTDQSLVPLVFETVARYIDQHHLY